MVYVPSKLKHLIVYVAQCGTETDVLHPLWDLNGTKIKEASFVKRYQMFFDINPWQVGQRRRRYAKRFWNRSPKLRSISYSSWGWKIIYLGA